MPPGTGITLVQRLHTVETPYLLVIEALLVISVSAVLVSQGLCAVTLILLDNGSKVSD